MSVARFFRWSSPGSSASPPATPTLTVADNGDGTGGVATITGSTSGSTNAVKYSLWTGNPGAITWTAAGSRTGDGTLALSLTPGLYVFKVSSTVSGITSDSSLYLQKLTPATYTFQVTATDSIGNVAIKTFSLTVNN